MYALFRIKFIILIFTLLFFINLGDFTYGKSAGDEKEGLYQMLSQSVVHISRPGFHQEPVFSPISQKGMASGFVIDRMGHVITSNQATRDLNMFEVVFSDGKKWPAKVLGEDSRHDIAILELIAPEKEFLSLPPLRLSPKTEIKPGNEVFSISNPFGTGYSVLKGVITSGLRSVARPDKMVVDSVIETDLSLTPGDAGSPIFDVSGNLLGMNTMIFNPLGEEWRRSFAISTEIILGSVSRIIDMGNVEWAWFGAKFISVTQGISTILNLPVTSGVMLTEVTKGGPAEKAGLKGADREMGLRGDIYPMGGDIIVSMDKKAISSDSDLLHILRYKAPGDVVEIRFYRNKKLKKTRVILGKAK